MNTAASLIIGVTSHRNIPAGETAAIQQRVHELFAHLQHEFPHSPLTVLSPLPEGGDQLVAEEALRVGSRLIAPLPLARNLYTRDFTDVAVREHFETLCAPVARKARSYNKTCEPPASDTGWDARRGGNRDDRELEHVVEAAHAAVAVYSHPAQANKTVRGTAFDPLE